MTQSNKNTQKIVIETAEGSFYLKKQSIIWEKQKPMFSLELTKAKAWALKTDHLTKDEIIREIHSNHAEAVIYAH